MQRFFPKLVKKEWLILLGIVILYLGLTTYNLTKLPIFVDEALYLRWSQIAWKDASWRFISLTDGKQPFYIWFVIPFLKVFKDPLYAGRLASVVSGLFTVLGLGYLGWLMKDKKTGFFAMTLGVLSPYLFFYYRFGIMESTLVASVIWVVILSILLAKSRRLDVALILGMVTGLSLLVKSSALFFCLLIPFAYVLDFKKTTLFTKKTLSYLFLVLIAWSLSYIIYNIQRLSPWMHMIAEKNSFFTVSYGEILAEPKRLVNNFLDVWRWQYAYSGLPILALFFLGLYRLMMENIRAFLYYLVLTMGPVLGTVAVASLFAPRYIIYATPFVLLSASYGLSSLQKPKVALIALLLALSLPIVLISKLLIDPIHFPYVPVDEGYVNGWSAGNGTKQIADWARARAKEIGGEKKLVIYTEGTFGILPHGLELYTQGVKNLEVIGVYPISDIPPAPLVSAAFENPETYLVLNNTVTPDTPAGLELVLSFPKLRENPMRLYKIIAR